MHRTTTILLGLATLATATAATSPADEGSLAGGSLAGQWFYDRDGDGVRQPDEPGFVGSLSVKILMDTWVATAHTDDSGHYRVDGLAPGEYRVIPQTGTLYGPTNPIETRVTVTEGGVANADFGTEGGEISGTAWQDVDADGTREPGEPPLSGIAVDLNSATGPRTVTAADGGYRFQDLNMTAYTVRFALRVDETFSPPGIGMEETDSDVIDFDDGSAKASITRGKPGGVNDARNVDAGYVGG